MTIKMTALRFRWAWTTLFAIAVFAVLAILDRELRARSGFGTLDLQSARTAKEVQTITTAWMLRGGAAGAGFNLGFDYLFMPLYGFAFYYSGLILRARFAPRPGIVRRIWSLAAAVPLAGAVLDAGENALEASMLFGRPTDIIAAYAYAVSSAKWLCIFFGLVLLLGAIVTLFIKRKAESESVPAHNQG